MKDKTTSAETQLTGEEEIFVHRDELALSKYGVGVFHRQPFDNALKFVRAAPAINESPKTDVTVFTITDKSSGIGRDYSITPTGLENGGEVIKKSDYDALRDELNVADDALETQVGWIAELRAERDSLARVNESLVAALNHVTRCLDETIIVVGRAVDQCSRNATAMVPESRKAVDKARAALALAEGKK